MPETKQPSVIDMAGKWWTEETLATFPKTADDLAEICADFARESVEEFIRKVEAECEHGNWRFVMNDAFCEMFGESEEKG